MGPYGFTPRSSAMGRTVPTYRLHLESILNDWMDYRRALREKDREAFDRILNKARQHASAASYCAHIDPTNLALLSVLLEMEKDLEAMRRRQEPSSMDPDSPRDGDPQRYAIAPSPYLAYPQT